MLLTFQVARVVILYNLTLERENDSFRQNFADSDERDDIIEELRERIDSLIDCEVGIKGELAEAAPVVAAS